MSISRPPPHPSAYISDSNIDERNQPATKSSRGKNPKKKTSAYFKAAKKQDKESEKQRAWKGKSSASPANNRTKPTYDRPFVSCRLPITISNAGSQYEQRTNQNVLTKKKTRCEKLVNTPNTTLGKNYIYRVTATAQVVERPRQFCWKGSAH